MPAGSLSAMKSLERALSHGEYARVTVTPGSGEGPLMRESDLATTAQSGGPPGGSDTVSVTGTTTAPAVLVASMRPPAVLGRAGGTVTVTVFEVADEVLAPCVPDVEPWFEIATAEAAASMRAQK